MNKKRTENEESGIPEESASSPEVKSTRRMSMVWFVPILAIVLGGWLVYRHMQSQGPLIEVQFGTADGIVAGKTEVRSRSVKVGLVEDVRLADKFKGVVISIRMDPKAASLVRLDSKFWVVRPRVTGANISGLGTLISGAYIELDPGFSEDTAREFVGLEEPPVTPSGVAGLRLNLRALGGGQVQAGSPVLFEGNTVGTIERRVFNPTSREVELSVFVNEKFTSLVTENVRFWEASGVKVTVGADGFKLDLPSLEALVGGGVTFGVPDGLKPGKEVDDGALFDLFADEAKALASVFRSGGEFLLLFDQSVRGLSIGARVEFRGLQVGRVEEISFGLGSDNDSRRVPVRVRLNQTLIDRQFPAAMRDEGGEGIGREIAKGLRASLRPSSLLTGQLFVDLDYYDDIAVGEIGKLGDYHVLPTAETGLARLEEQLAAVLRKLENLPLEDSLAKINVAVEESSKTLEAAGKAFARSEDALVEARDSLQAVRMILEDPNFSKLPGEVRETLLALRSSIDGVGPKSSVYGDLRRTMDELRGAARSIERVANTIEEKPNSLVFGKGLKKEVIPRAIPTR